MIIGGKQKRVGQLHLTVLELNLFPVKYGSAFKPVPGYDLKVLNSEGKEVGPGKMGDIVVKLPLPPGTFPTLWGADKRYKENYMSTYPGYISNL